MQTILFATAGIALIVFTLVDAFVTILSLRGGGPATTFITRKIWYCLLRIHRARTMHDGLAISGPALLIVIVVLWYAMLYLGWFLVFCSIDQNILNSNNLTAASGLQKWYFTGVTLSGLGYGDFTATEAPWTVYSTLAVFTGTLLTSLALSYIIAVVPVALEKRQIANQISAVADDFDELKGLLDKKANVEFIWQQLFEIQLGGTSFSNKYSAYPVVTYFHAPDTSGAFSLAYLKSTDTLFYLANHPNADLRPSIPAVRTFKCTVRNHVQNLSHVIDENDYDQQSHERNFQPGSHIAGLATGHGFDWEEYRDLRKTLVIACQYDGW